VERVEAALKSAPVNAQGGNLSPEQAFGQAECDAESDFVAFAVDQDEDGDYVDSDQDNADSDDDDFSEDDGG
jgi:hypothetical protein